MARFVATKPVVSAGGSGAKPKGGGGGRIDDVDDCGKGSAGGGGHSDVDHVDDGKSIRYLRTPWATSCLVVNGFIYNCHSVKANGTKYWRCHNYSKKAKEQRCKARCVIRYDQVHNMTNEHNHPPQRDKILKYRSREGMRSSLELLEKKGARGNKKGM